MCLKDSVTVGNLPVGKLDEQGNWCHKNGNLMRHIVLDFMEAFAPRKTLVIKKVDMLARTITIQMPNALAVTKTMRVIDSPLHRVLQVLVHPDSRDCDASLTDNPAGADVQESQQRFFLRHWLRVHPASNASIWDEFLGVHGLLVDESEWLMSKWNTANVALRRGDSDHHSHDASDLLPDHPVHQSHVPHDQYETEEQILLRLEEEEFEYTLRRYTACVYVCLCDSVTCPPR